jgi:hypothetical protein
MIFKVVYITISLLWLSGPRGGGGQARDVTSFSLGGALSREWAATGRGWKVAGVVLP